MGKGRGARGSFRGLKYYHSSPPGYGKFKKGVLWLRSIG